MSICKTFASQRLKCAWRPCTFAIPGVKGADYNKGTVGCKYCRNTPEKTRFLRKFINSHYRSRFVPGAPIKTLSFPV